MEETIILRGEYIKLDQALKHVLGVSGGEAKDMILDGRVFVNGEEAFQRGKKLRDGDTVETDDVKIFIKE
ncbi:MAG: RNA-binding S4 domain-containing protein [Clostridia bacterium]|nr:RNA-binding S4 domain-containing protein [Clostridia bacterium]